MAIPTAFPKPWPNGPVVSIPVPFLYSGCPAQIEFNCLKFLYLQVKHFHIQLSKVKNKQH